MVGLPEATTALGHGMQHVETTKSGRPDLEEADGGFSAQPGAGMIPPDSEPDESPCLYCSDPLCQEWPDVWALGPDGKPNGGVWCHVAECQMEDIEDAER